MTVDQNTQTSQQDQQPQTQQTNDPQSTQQADDRSVGGIKYYKELLDKERQEREKLSSEIENIRKGKLIEQNQWKELYEQEQKKSVELQSKLSNISTAFIDDKKRSVIEKEAIAAGILPSALEDLDLIDKSIIEVETTSTGKINFNNVKTFVDTLKLKKPHWFGAGVDPNINNKRPEFNQTGELNIDQILELQSKDPKKYNEIMRQRLGITPR